MSTTAITPEVFKKEYQPKDASGNPVGPPQVFEGASWQEVTDKIAEAHEHASAKIHELRSKIKPEPAPPAPQGLKPLSADELFRLEQIKDPQEQFAERLKATGVTEKLT